MKLATQKRIAASLLKCGLERVRFDPKSLYDIKEAITKSDMRLLVSDGLVWAEPIKGVSRARARKTQVQKRKGLRKGFGSKKGTQNASTSDKEKWMLRVRSQRSFLQELKEKSLISIGTFRNLYRKSKGGFFRSKRHIKLYIDDQRLWQQKEKKSDTVSETETRTK